MVVMKMVHMKHIPEYCDDCIYYGCKPHPYKGWTDSCDDCIYYGCKPHPYKGWTDSCELCMQCLDDDQEKGWIYDGNGRPTNCPLMEVDDSQAESEDCISREELDKALRNFIRNFPSINPQEPKLDTLDEIRAEIMDWETDIYENEYDAEIHDFVFERIYEIIDEHKAESEE